MIGGMEPSDVTDTPRTSFASPQRADPRAISAHVELIGSLALLNELCEATGEVVLILNAQRQIVYINRNGLSLLGVERAEAIHGLRPGEAFGCIHAAEVEHGCGTSAFCEACGAVNAILGGQAGRACVAECRIRRGTSGDALDLRVRTTPLELEGQSFTLCSLSDISHEKRRRALERVFFHDVLNTAGAVRMLGELFHTAAGARRHELGHQLLRAMDQLVEELSEHRDLTAAESAELTVSPQLLVAGRFLDGLLDLYRSCSIGRGRRLELDVTGPDATFRSDGRLLSRVLGNLIKNALEGCPAGAVVTAGCGAADGGVQFTVHNPGVMDRQVQLQIFQRSFSTKGPGRGLGTYSVKLLTERYLQGRVWFTSDADSGTVFQAWYPAQLRP